MIVPSGSRRTSPSPTRGPGALLEPRVGGRERAVGDHRRPGRRRSAGRRARAGSGVRTLARFASRPITAMTWSSCRTGIASRRIGRSPSQSGSTSRKIRASVKAVRSGGDPRAAQRRRRPGRAGRRSVRWSGGTGRRRGTPARCPPRPRARRPAPTAAGRRRRGRRAAATPRPGARCDRPARRRASVRAASVSVSADIDLEPATLRASGQRARSARSATRALRSDCRGVQASD